MVMFVWYIVVFIAVSHGFVYLTKINHGPIASVWTAPSPSLCPSLQLLSVWLWPCWPVPATRSPLEDRDARGWWESGNICRFLSPYRETAHTQMAGHETPHTLKSRRITAVVSSYLHPAVRQPGYGSTHLLTARSRQSIPLQNTLHAYGIYSSSACSQ